jgi:hypothetical protein
LIKATHQAAAAITDARIRVIDGQLHLAYKSDPDVAAPIIRQFILL